MPEKPRSVAFDINNADDITFKNVTVEGADIGIRARNTRNLKLDNFGFEGDGRAFDIQAESAEIKGTRIKSTPSKAGSFVGWVKPNGPPLPAQCPHCKSIFPSRHYNVEIPRFLVKNNLETCPVCGHHEATLAEGLFDLVGEFVKALEADGATIAMLKALGAPTESFLRGETSVSETIHQIEKISPAAAKVLSKPNVVVIGASVALLFTAMGSLNIIHDFNDNYRISEYGTLLYRWMSGVVIEGNDTGRFELKQIDTYKKPRLGARIDISGGQVSGTPDTLPLPLAAPEPPAVQQPLN
ncbi:hypothetical protein NBH19_21860 [Rhizobium sp. S95]|uniref:Uncharacterized protein n=1 Tax=Ciceribacter sichuanensis TaxID=2949647 RepID=A0AAJ1F4V1_9HYPH|nr:MULTISPECIES: hypothetical protein [unclassified Ciceribacter]MCM2398729.1 hypothetical protein [Ciceribacter sp. S95]MCO5957065.1 hypothetical protein [Ciceribacter sp. S101]